MQHLPPSRWMISWRMVGLGAGGGRPRCEAYREFSFLYIHTGHMRTPRLTAFNNVRPIFHQVE